MSNHYLDQIIEETDEYVILKTIELIPEFTDVEHYITTYPILQIINTSKIKSYTAIVYTYKSYKIRY